VAIEKVAANLEKLGRASIGDNHPTPQNFI
jgi:hypothetical protein